MKKILYILVAVIALLLIVSCGQVKLPDGGREESGGEEGDGAVSWAGIRVSEYGMEDAYGDFPSTTKMKNLVGTMSSYYKGSKGTVILIVGTISSQRDKSGNITKGSCSLEFPLSKEITNARGSDVDFYDSYLSVFDRAGYSVWLQVEPGDANLVELATEVMSHYAPRHKCVKGFGIDVEWYKYRKNASDKEGDSSGISDTEAQQVVEAVRAVKNDFGIDYTVFVKHWDEDYLPPEYRDGLIFVSDSQIYRSIDAMRDDFAGWAEHYAPNPVMFQIGYNADKWFWSKLENPARDLGAYIAAGCNSGNEVGIIWVDFTLKEVLN